jgi:hypothetical protein
MIDYSGAPWRKASHSNGQANCVEVATAWRKASYSDGQAECVEVGQAARVVAVRDTQDREGPALAVTPAAWQEFTAGIRAARR